MRNVAVCITILLFIEYIQYYNLVTLVQVMESEEFLLLPAAQLIDIVSSDELNVRSEEQTFQAVMSWVKYNVAERRQHLAQVTFTVSD